MFFAEVLDVPVGAPLAADVTSEIAPVSHKESQVFGGRAVASQGRCGNLNKNLVLALADSSQRISSELLNRVF